GAAGGGGGAGREDGDQVAQGGGVGERAGQAQRGQQGGAGRRAHGAPPRPPGRLPPRRLRRLLACAISGGPTARPTSRIAPSVIRATWTPSPRLADDDTGEAATCPPGAWP